MGSESQGTDFLPNAKEGKHGDGVVEQCLNASSGHVTRPANMYRELVQPSGLALWVKWRGKWQAGIQCSLDDCPSATLKAMPTYGRKTYIVIFFPYSRSHCWTDSQLVCAISERPEPLAFGTHEIGQEMVMDLSIPRRYMLQKLAVTMLEASDQLHVEAVVESARNVNAWKEFAKEAAQCTVYTDLGRMLIKLRSMILEIYISPSFLRTSDLWKQQCKNTKTAESTEKLAKDLMDAILWDEVANLWNAPSQTALGAEWKTWKREAMKLFPISNPSTPSIFERNFDKESREEYMRITDTPDSNNFENSRKRLKLEIRRGNSSEVKDVNDSRFVGPSELLCPSYIPYTRESQLVLYPGDSKSMTEELVMKNQSLAEIQPSSINLGHRRCSAFIEKKGRNCNRFVSEGNIYCVKHFSLNTPENFHEAGHSESSFLNVHTDSNFLICQGMTKYGKQCTHRTRNGTPFCMKHMFQDGLHIDDCDTTPSSSTLGNSQKRARASVEGCSLERETTSGDHHHANSQNIQSFVPFSDLETIHGNIIKKLDSESCAGARQQSQNFSLQERILASKVSNRSGNWSRCLGSCRNRGGQCSHRAKQGSAYCEKHLPSSLGHHNNIFTASMLNGIFKNTTYEESHCSNSKDLLQELVRSRLSDGGNYALVLENLQDPEALLKEVSAEKQKLAKYFGFDERESNAVASSPGISDVQNTVDSVAAVGNGITMQSFIDGMDDSQSIHDFAANEAQKQKCKSCSQELSDLHSLGLHCITVHKKAAEWHFRGYACCNCSSSFTNKKGLERHVKIHHKGVTLEQCMGYFCIPCGNLSHFMDCDQLWQHVLLAHNEELNQSICIKEQVKSSESSKYLNVEQDKQELVLMQYRSNEFGSAHMYESNHSSMTILNEDSVVERRTFARDSVRRFSCRFCGMKFSLLPDLGRHHQAKHMDSNSGYKSRPKRGKEAFTAKWRANKANLRTIHASTGFKHAAVIAGKKRFKKNNLPRSICVDNRVQLCNQSEIHDRLSESNLLSVLDMLLSEGQKVRPLPNNLEILNVARSACCRTNLQAALEARYGSLSEKLYIKAARICSEENIRVEWHREGFICPKGCKPKFDTQASAILAPLPDVWHSPLTIQANHKGIVTKETHTEETCENIESHLVLNTCDLKRSHQRKSIILLEDLSSGKEAVPIPCMVDVDVISTNGEDQNLDTIRPWESFSYIAERLLDSSLGLAARSSQLGCTCTQPKCFPESCDHVYLFENDNENALDISGKPMNGRFPYDDKGRIILGKGYLVYECNSMCSCQKECQNRVLQNGVQVKLEVYKTKNKGWGVRAAEVIPCGTFVCEYIGEVLNDEEASKRGERYDKDECSYLYDIDPHIDRNELNEFMEVSKPYVIDATHYGNVARFLNHSCSPNLVNYQVLVESMDCQLAHIGLYASRDIVIGEELSYDYHYKLLPGEGRTCHCGSENCRGRLF